VCRGCCGRCWAWGTVFFSCLCYDCL